MIRTHPEPLHHAAAHHTPAQGAHYFPEFYARNIDFAATLLVAREQLLARTEATDRLFDLAPPPGVDADPPQVFHRIAEMRELPVQHGPDAIGADDEIAVAEVAVH